MTYRLTTEEYLADRLSRLYNADKPTITLRDDSEDVTNDLDIRVLSRVLPDFGKGARDLRVSLEAEEPIPDNYRQFEAHPVVIVVEANTYETMTQVSRWFVRNGDRVGNDGLEPRLHGDNAMQLQPVSMESSVETGRYVGVISMELNGNVNYNS